MYSLFLNKYLSVLVFEPALYISCIFYKGSELYKNRILTYLFSKVHCMISIANEAMYYLCSFSFIPFSKYYSSSFWMCFTKHNLLFLFPHSHCLLHLLEIWSSSFYCQFHSKVFLIPCFTWPICLSWVLNSI